MKIIVCVDDKKGMLFGSRRQSRDRVLCEYLSKNYTPLYINEFSKPLFENAAVTDDFSKVSGWCFVENVCLKEHLDKIDAVVVCRWNRAYPADTFFGLPLERFTLKSSTDIVGSSHEKITVEEYIR